MAATPSVVALHKFAQTLKRILSPSCTGVPPRNIGLAISGGVDSMALASLCSQLKQSDPDTYNFTAFVVDHKLRPNSSQEALAVRDMIQQLPGNGIPAQILTINADENDIKHVEKYARQGRYRAIGRACAEAGIETVLVAHHADDAAITTLQRLTSRFYGRGLIGIRERVNIPECNAMYGINQSGRPQVLKQRHKFHRQFLRQHVEMSFEDGGIQIIRPLLEYPKAELIATCLKHAVSWVEDPTNSDVTYTKRNTIKHLHDQGLLPAALSKERLRKLRTSIESREQQLEHDALRFLERTTVRFEPNAGCLHVSVPLQRAEYIQNHKHAMELKQRMLRTLFYIVSPYEVIELSRLHRVADNFLNEHRPPTHESVAASVKLCVRSIDKHGYQYLISRTNPVADQVPAAILPFDILNTEPTKDGYCWSEWQLWDGRYWIRVGQEKDGPPLPSSLVVRHLRINDLRSDRKDASHLSVAKHVRSAGLPSYSRLTLPVLAIKNDQATGEEQAPHEEETVVALPSLSCSLPTFRHVGQASRGAHVHWVYDIRYKKIHEMYYDGGPQASQPNDNSPIRRVMTH